jgi:hypothetical protein
VRRSGAVLGLEVALREQQPAGRVEREARQRARPREARALGQRRLRAFGDDQLLHAPAVDAGERERRLAAAMLLAREIRRAAAAARVDEHVPREPDAAVAADRERRVEVVRERVGADGDDRTERAALRVEAARDHLEVAPLPLRPGQPERAVGRDGERRLEVAEAAVAGAHRRAEPVALERREPDVGAGAPAHRLATVLERDPALAAAHRERRPRQAADELRERPHRSDPLPVAPHEDELGHAALLAHEDDEQLGGARRGDLRPEALARRRRQEHDARRHAREHLGERDLVAARRLPDEEREREAVAVEDRPARRVALVDRARERARRRQPRVGVLGARRDVAVARRVVVLLRGRARRRAGAGEREQRRDGGREARHFFGIATKTAALSLVKYCLQSALMSATVTASYQWPMLFTSSSAAGRCTASFRTFHQKPSSSTHLAESPSAAVRSRSISGWVTPFAPRVTIMSVIALVASSTFFSSTSTSSVTAP